MAGGWAFHLSELCRFARSLEAATEGGSQRAPRSMADVPYCAVEIVTSLRGSRFLAAQLRSAHPGYGRHALCAIAHSAGRDERGNTVDPSRGNHSCKWKFPRGAMGTGGLLWKRR